MKQIVLQGKVQCDINLKAFFTHILKEPYIFLSLSFQNTDQQTHSIQAIQAVSDFGMRIRVYILLLLVGAISHLATAGDMMLQFFPQLVRLKCSSSIVRFRCAGHHQVWVH